MRPGFRLCLLGGVALVLFAFVLVSRQIRTMFTTEPGATVSVEPVQQGEPQALQPVEAPVSGPIKKANAQTREEEDEARERAKETRIAELRELGRKTDRASLETLLSELKNPNQEIRQAVLDIISQSGNRDAIPYLADAAAQTDDPELKKAITEVAEFLKLPTLTEVLRQTNPTNGGAGSETKAVVPPRQ